MAQLPTQSEQIVQAHAALIVAVVQTVHNPSLRPELDEVLRVSAQNGWTDLVRAIHEVLKGRRDETLLQTLDDEDRSIVEAILRGLQNPETLPDPARGSDPAMAAPGLAHMIHAAGTGKVEALEALGTLAQQMSAAGGEMARIGAIMGRLSNGERDPETLTQGMGAQGESLVLSLLEELGKLETH